MFNYIKADLYRIFRKKSMYMYFGILAIGYILMLVIFSITEGGKILGEISPIFMLVSLFGGGYLFATVYNDDLTAKTLPALIGFGIKRRMIVIAKFIVHTLMTLLLCLGTLLLIYITLILLGLEITANVSSILFPLLITTFLQLLAFSSIASMLVYGVQKAPLSIVGFILLVITLVNWMFRKILGTQVITNIFGDVSQYMIEPIVKTLVETPSIMTIIPYIIYIAICIVLSILVFRKKELEF